MKMRCEMLLDDRMFRAGVEILAAMRSVAPIPMLQRGQYVGDCQLLMLYGMGHIHRREWWKHHVALGGLHHMIGFDLGYWPKGPREDRPMRLTIDADHPWRLIDDRPSDRFEAWGVRLHDDYDSSGPIVIVGLGIKTNLMLHQAVTSFEHNVLKKIRLAYPDARIIYRPKTDDGTYLPDTELRSTGPIEDVLRGASLVVCRHSNVAVDACIAGIPVVCDDGAAAALYGAGIDEHLAAPKNPTMEQRLRFLYSVAYWQWRPSEARQCWDFILNKIKGIGQ